MGLVVSFDELRYGNDAHLRDVFAGARALYKLHVPFAAVPAENLISGRLARHRVVIAPEVRHLSEAQVAAFRRFVQNGGRLLVTGAFGVRDELASPRPEAPFADAPDLKAAFVTPPLETRKGAVFRLNSIGEIVPKREGAIVEALDIRNRETFLARVRELGSALPDEAAYDDLNRRLAHLGGGDLRLTTNAPTVCTVAYQRLGDEQGWMTVHAVRYAVPTWGGEGTARSPLPVKLQVPLPAGWTVRRASVLSPDTAPVIIAGEADSQKMRCDLPAFEYYSLLKLELRLSKRER